MKRTNEVAWNYEYQMISGDSYIVEKADRSEQLLRLTATNHTILKVRITNFEEVYWTGNVEVQLP